MTGVQDGGWSLRYSRRAEKDVARLDPPVRRRVLNALGRFADDPGVWQSTRIAHSSRYRGGTPDAASKCGLVEPANAAGLVGEEQPSSVDGEHRGAAELQEVNPGRA